MAASKRARQLPNVATFPELGYDNVQVYALNGLMVPAGASGDAVRPPAAKAEAGGITHILLSRASSR